MEDVTRNHKLDKLNDEITEGLTFPIVVPHLGKKFAVFIQSAIQKELKNKRRDLLASIGSNFLAGEETSDTVFAELKSIEEQIENPPLVEKIKLEDELKVLINKVTKALQDKDNETMQILIPTITQVCNMTFNTCMTPGIFNVLQFTHSDIVRSTVTATIVAFMLLKQIDKKNQTLFRKQKILSEPDLEISRQIASITAGNVLGKVLGLTDTQVQEFIENMDFAKNPFSDE